MEAFLNCLNTIAALKASLRAKKQRALMFPSMRKGLRLIVPQQRNYIFFPKRRDHE